MDTEKVSIILQPSKSRKIEMKYDHGSRLHIILSTIESGAYASPQTLILLLENLLFHPEQ